LFKNKAKSKKGYWLAFRTRTTPKHVGVYEKFTENLLFLFVVHILSSRIGILASPGSDYEQKRFNKKRQRRYFRSGGRSTLNYSAPDVSTDMSCRCMSRWHADMHSC